MIKKSNCDSVSRPGDSNRREPPGRNGAKPGAHAVIAAPCRNEPLEELAHDLTNMLAGILCHVSLLRQNPELNQEVKDTLRGIEDEILRGAEVARKLLSPARMRSKEADQGYGSMPADSAIQAPPFHEQAGRHEVRGGSETVLLVEDNIPLRRVAALCLRKLGYAVLEAGNAPEALGQWAKHRTCIDLLLTDMVLPESITGLELAHRLMGEKPALKVILGSGYSAEPVKADLRLPGIGFLSKPYEPATLARCVRKRLDGE